MNIFKRAISCFLSIVLAAALLPASVMADDDEYRISNEYLNFNFNKKTGGFAIETAEGNPQKVLDNDIPLLYAREATEHHLLRRKSAEKIMFSVRITDFSE